MSVSKDQFDLDTTLRLWNIDILTRYEARVILGIDELPETTEGEK